MISDDYLINPLGIQRQGDPWGRNRRLWSAAITTAE
jgi:hypothetical protein